MMGILLWPFRFAWSVLSLVFDFALGLIGAVFGLVGGLLGFIFSGMAFVLVVIGIVVLVRMFIRRMRGV